MKSKSALLNTACYTSVIAILFISSCNTPKSGSCVVESDLRDYPITAHSHNDYDQDEPIITAINHGFSSIEADIYYEDSKLYVSHDDKDLEKKSTLSVQYLDQLVRYLEDDHKDIQLLVDIKNYSVELIELLNQELSTYAQYLVSRDAPLLTKNKIKIVLSGVIDREKLIADDNNQYLFIDGRISDLDKYYPSSIVPMISENASRFEDENQLKIIIDEVHNQGKTIRLWNTEDTEATWLQLLALKLDFIGVDDINKFYCIMKANGHIN